MSINKEERIDVTKTKAGVTPVFMMPIKEARECMHHLFVDGRELDDVKQVKDIQIPCVWGKLNVRVYYPHTVIDEGGLVYFHGGGWILNSVETHDNLCRKIANESSRIVVSVESRRAPEHQFPAAIEDAVNAVQWVYDNCNAIGISSKKIAVAGDSSGGTQAAIVCQYFRDRNGVKIEKQVLIYPPTDYYWPGTPSSRANEMGFAIWAWNNFIPPLTNLDNPYLFPLRGERFDNLPPAFVLVAEQDGLKDEGKMYATKMKQAGCDVELKEYPDVAHGFIMRSEMIPQGKEAIKDVGNFLKK